MQNIDSYEILPQKKVFVDALIEVVPSYIKKVKCTRSAEKWKEKAIEAFGLQDYSKNHPFERKKATRPVDEFYDELSEICR